MPDLDLSYCPVDNASLMHFNTDITHADLSYTEITDIRPIVSNNLTSLNVAGCPFDDHSLFAASAIALTSLNVSWTEVSDIGFAILDCVRLTTLDASHTHITDTTLMCLYRAPLKSLRLRHTSVTGRHLSWFKLLRRLDLTATLFNSIHLTELSRTLIHLNLSEVRLPPHTLALLKELPVLTELYLESTQLNDDGLKYLYGLVLDMLGLGHNLITDAGLRYCRGFCVDYLDLSHNLINGCGFKELEGVTLEVLDVSHNLITNPMPFLLYVDEIRLAGNPIAHVMGQDNSQDDRMSV